MHLGQGVDHASDVYGGDDFALAFGGNEMPGYHTGPAAHLTYLTGARHSHLDSGGYGIDQKAAAQEQELVGTEVADKLLAEERWRQILSSLVVCFFARGVYTAEVILRSLSTVGIDLGEGDLIRMGAEILALKYAFKRREGFDLSQVRIPARILSTPSTVGQIDETVIREALERYGAQVDQI